MSKEVWVLTNNEIWEVGKLIENRDDRCIVDINNELLEYDKDQVKQMAHEDLTKIDDLIKLSHLHEPSILDTLIKKYNIDSIYTNTGPVLIAVNPYHGLNIYTKEYLEKYNTTDLPEESHVYLVAASALKDLKEFNRSQTILASGESGSGKTVTTKHLLHFLTWSSNNAQDLEKKIVYSTPLMESFGNAKTIRNDNSSRFGKFIKVFMDDGKIKSASIQTYLLEKIRVIEQNPGERNFHIFYQLLDSDIKEKFKLKTIGDYRILSNKDNKSVELSFKDEVDSLEGLIESFKKLNFSDEDINNIFKCITIILNLGNVDIDNKDINDSEYLDIVLDLSGWNKSHLVDFVCHEYIQAGVDTIKKDLNKEQSVLKLNTFIQVLYETLFNWITNKINKELEIDNGDYKFIGILDIFGFEIFENNSLEQFHINYTNENLQQIFNKTIFKTEQEEYEKEKIDWSFVEYIDNMDRLDAIDGKQSIFSYLDQECIIPKGTDSSLISKYTKLTSPHVSFTNLGVAKGEFTFSHYAGDVTYNVNGFCHKNKFHINSDLFNVIQQSNDKFLNILFENVSYAKESSMKTTISSTFKKQLSNLITTIDKTHNHFVRCIKPNDINKPNNINAKKVMMQLRYGGITEAVRVVRAGFPVKFTHNYFRERYFALTMDKNINLDDFKENLDNTNPNHIQIGLTKIYMKQEVYESIEELKMLKLNKYSVEIQRITKGFYYRKKFIKLKESTKLFQRIYRGHLARIRVNNIRIFNSATRIQCNVKMMLNRKNFINLKHSQLVVSKSWKNYRLRTNINILNKHVKHIHKILLSCRSMISATIIQRWYRIRKKELGDKLHQLMKEVERTKKEKELELARIKKEQEERERELQKIKEEELHRLKEQMEQQMKEQLDELRRQEEAKIEEEINKRKLEEEKRKKEMEEELERIKKRNAHAKLKAELEFKKKLKEEQEEKQENANNFGTAMNVNQSLTIRIQQVLDENEELRKAQRRLKELEENNKKGLWGYLFG